jgi:hypothetical protein
MQAMTPSLYALIDYFSWKKPINREMVCNRLGFLNRLVLYWPHIGLIITKHKGVWGL